MSGDAIVRLIGLAMALTLVLAGGRLRAVPRRNRLTMAAVWIVIIVSVSFFFSAFHP